MVLVIFVLQAMLVSATWNVLKFRCKFFHASIDTCLEAYFLILPLLRNGDNHRSKREQDNIWFFGRGIVVVVVQKMGSLFFF